MIVALSRGFTNDFFSLLHARIHNSRNIRLLKFKRTSRNGEEGGVEVEVVKGREAFLLYVRRFSFLVLAPGRYLYSCMVCEVAFSLRSHRQAVGFSVVVVWCGLNRCEWMDSGLVASLS